MLEEKINQDYIQAMKERNTAKSSTINFLRAQLKNYRIDSRLEKLSDEDVIKVIKKQIKQRQDSIEQYKQGNRQDLVEKETFEFNTLKSYLPQELSLEEVTKIVDEAIKEVGAKGMNDMGKVMKVAVPKIAGRADNKALSDLIKKSLTEI